MSDEIMVPLSQLHDEMRITRALGEEVARLRKKNADLNRRAQLAEKVASENVNACEKKGVSLGRGLAIWAYQDLKRKLRELSE